MSKNNSSGCVGLGLVLIVLLLMLGLKERVGDTMFIVIMIAAVAVGIYLSILYNKAKKRRMAERIAELLNKYGDREIVDRIIDKNYWQGQTTEMLIDSLGSPSAVEEEILKTKKKEIWKYFPEGSNHFKLRVTLENDVVVGWKRR